MGQSLEVDGPEEGAVADIFLPEPASILRSCCRVLIRQQNNGYGLHHLGDLVPHICPPLAVNIPSHLGLWVVHGPHMVLSLGREDLH